MKNQTEFVCRECGQRYAKWAGRCDRCGAWNTLEEHLIVKNAAPSCQSAASFEKKARSLAEIGQEEEERISAGIREVNRVLGGGIVRGSVVLISGDPGIGKSTILLQIAEHFPKDKSVLYVSGEESASQIKLRAQRLGVRNENLKLMTDTDTLGICEYIQSNLPDLVIIDSIQTMQIADIPSSPGSIVQVRESANAFFRVAKTTSIPIFIVGHINKGGEIAGPKILEHIVDTVLYFEGERNQSYRILRAIKNRFGSTNEIGVFEMRDTGLCEVENPSAVLLSGRAKEIPGSCITCVMEGTRPLLAEVQGLVASSGFGNPRRVSTGFDYNRLNLLLAVLEKRSGLHFSNLDTYLNVAGGIRLDEPAADLAVAISLCSALRDVPVDEGLIAFGEIGLSGELRSVPNVLIRIAEAQRLGFRQVLLPRSCRNQLEGQSFDIELLPVPSLGAALKLIGR